MTFWGPWDTKMWSINYLNILPFSRKILLLLGFFSRWNRLHECELNSISLKTIHSINKNKYIYMLNNCHIHSLTSVGIFYLIQGQTEGRWIIPAICGLWSVNQWHHCQQLRTALSRISCSKIGVLKIQFTGSFWGRWKEIRGFIVFQWPLILWFRVCLLKKSISFDLKQKVGLNSCLM